MQPLYSLHCQATNTQFWDQKIPASYRVWTRVSNRLQMAQASITNPAPKTKSLASDDRQKGRPIQ